MKDLAHIDNEQAKRLDNVTVEKEDILLNITGASVARCTIVPEKILPARVNQHVSIIRVIKEKADPYFVLYSLNSKHYKHRLLSLAQGGSTREALTKEMIENFEIKLPPLSVQQKISSILSAYDDLIENNNRRIAILEEMARRLYDEWFVKFRFPGHEKVKMVDSELGLIPEGWEVVSFTQIADVMSGGTPNTKVEECWNGDIPFFAPKDAPTSTYCIQTEKSITELGLSKCNSKLYPKNTVFITARGTVGKVVMPAVDMAMNQSCYALKGREGIGQYFLFLLTKKQVGYLKKNTGGATFDTIVVDTFKRMKIIKPNNALIENFERMVDPLFDMNLNLILRNRNLREQRDILLPKLISGKIEL